MSWHPQHRPRLSIPPPLLPWLVDRGSLTDRLLRESAGDFRVEVLSQRWGSCRHDERLLLRLAPRARTLLREVILYGCGEPWVYARSVLPAQSLEHRLRFLKRIGTKPLGAVLFSDPHLQRGDIEIVSGPARDAAAPPSLPAHAGVWGRRSVFYLKHKPLLVSEMFLPDFVARLERT